MAEGSGEEAASILLRTLPVEVSESILQRLGGEAAERLRARMKSPATVPALQELDTALTQFFDLQRIADRTVPPAGEYRPVAVAPETRATGEINELKALSADLVARALADEPPAAIALVLTCLEPSAAGQVIRRLPTELRADVVVRLTRSGARNPQLLEQLVRAVTEKGRRLAELPVEPSVEDRTNALGDMLRALPRPERGPMLQRLEAAAPELAAAIRERLYRIEDLVRIQDRQLQLLLTELEVKKLAIALKGAPDSVRDKILNNMSTRAKAALTEETELLGEVPATGVRQARTDLMDVLRRLEEEGRIVIEE
jgi:flagellar motor switch protein FliG